MRVVVVGAGIFGVAAALALRARGVDVVLLDQGPVPHPDAATTDLSKLIRADYGSDTFYRDLMARALPGWRRWNLDFGRNLFHETGLLVVSDRLLSDDTFEGSSLMSLAAADLPVHRLWPADWERLSAWNPWSDGYVSRAAGWAESGEVLAALWARCDREGVQTEDRVGPIEVLDGPVARASGRTWAGDVVVVAAGAWTPVVLPELADRIVPIGQPVFHLRPEDTETYVPPRFLPWAADIARTGWYGFPATSDGRVKIANHGTGVVTDPLGARVVPDVWEERLRVFLRDRLPGLADAPIVGRRLCLYSDSFDGDLFVDRVPGRDGVVVASGGSGHAFKFAPVLGELVADVAMGGPALPRFAWRARGDERLEAARSRA